MKIVSAGGGTGGHVTPVLAVINELSQHDPSLQAWFICDRGFAVQTKRIMSRATVPVAVKVISAGKLRRYYGIPLWRQLLDIPTVLRNIRDVFLLSLGFVQSLFLLMRIKPDAVFTKGGFVCVPVGLAAKVLRIPLVIHDSEAEPGLTNRILGRFAAAIATAAPIEGTSYPPAISHYVGIPVVNDANKPANEAERAGIKQDLGYDPAMPLVLVTGGGLGAKRINDALLPYARELAAKAQVVHLAGTKHASILINQLGSVQNYTVLPFVDKEMPLLMRAADVVVTRAGATTLLELAASAAPTIIVPHPHLTGGHQLKNGAFYAEQGGAVLINEVDLKDKPALLKDAIFDLLDNPKKREQMRQNILTLAKPDAARDTAKLIVSAIKKPVGERP